MYSCRGLDRYRSVIKAYKADARAVELWDTRYAPSDVIGSDMWLLGEYMKEDPSLTFEGFVGRYLSDGDPSFSFATCTGDKERGRSEGQVRAIASRFVGELSSMGGVGEELLSVDMAFDLIIAHACYETYVGKRSELMLSLYMERLIRDAGKEGMWVVSKAPEKCDKDGVDIVVEDMWGRRGIAVQVKPVSFVRMKGEGKQKEDKLKCYAHDEEYRAYAEGHPEEFAPKGERFIRYCLYDSRRGGGFLVNGRDGSVFFRVWEMFGRDGRPAMDVGGCRICEKM